MNHPRLPPEDDPSAELASEDAELAGPTMSVGPPAPRAARSAPTGSADTRSPTLASDRPPPTGPAKIAKLERLGDMPVVGALGAGGMGEVLLVRDEAVGRDLAAKVLRRHLLADATSVRKFVLEARITGQLEHPNIVPMHGIGRTGDDQMYFTMKRVEGETLERVLAQSSKKPSRRLLQRLQIFLKVCDAVGYAHDKGVIHRDLKPANVMVGKFGEVLVMDWGLAKVLADREPDAAERAVVPAPADTQGAPLLTMDGQVMGTPTYMPPEQARGEVDRLGPRSDIYSLGAILYQTLCGEPPYRGANGWEILDKLIHGPPPPPTQRAHGKDIPWELEAVVLRAMAREPDERYGTAAELSADLEAYLAGRTLEAVHYSALQRLAKWIARHRALVVSIAVVAAAVGGMAATFEARSRSEAAARADEAARHIARSVAAAHARTDALLRGVAGAEALTVALDERIRAHAAGQLGASADHAPAVSAYLGAAQVLDRALVLASTDPSLVTRRRDVGFGLAWSALLNGDDALAEQAIQMLPDLGAEPDAVAALRERARASHEALRTWRLSRIDVILGAIRSGLLHVSRSLEHWHRHIETLDDYCREVSGFRDVAIVGRLVAELDASRAAVAKAQEDLAGRGAQVAWTRMDRDRVTFCLRALGGIGLSECVAPLVAWLVDPPTEELEIEAGRALCETRQPEAFAPLIALRDREGFESPRWKEIKPQMRRVPIPRALSEASTDDPDALERYAFLLLDGDRTREAAAVYDRLIELDEGKASTRYFRGLARQILGDPAGAIADFDAAIALDPRHVDAYLHRAVVRQSQGDAIGAFGDFTRVIEIDPRNAFALELRVALITPTPDAVLQLLGDLDRAIAAKPEWARLRRTRAQRLVIVGRGVEAFAEASRALELDPLDPENYLLRAALSRARCDHQRTLEDLDRLLALYPTHTLGIAMRARAYYDLGRHAEAEVEVARCERHGGAEPLADVVQGLVLARRGRVDDAVRSIERALQRDPGSAPAFAARGLIKRDTGDVPGALSDLDQAVARDPIDAPHRCVRGETRHLSGDTNGALEDYTAVLALGWPLAAPLSNRSAVLRERGQPLEALVDAERALALDPMLSAAMFNRGMAQRDLGRLEPALADFRELVRRKASAWEARFYEGATLVQLGQRDAGLAAMRDAEARAPDAAKAQIAREIAKVAAK